jgi:hypothetical protein
LQEHPVLSGREISFFVFRGYRQDEFVNAYEAIRHRVILAIFVKNIFPEKYFSKINLKPVAGIVWISKTNLMQIR